jgi:hypothetical protein
MKYRMIKRPLMNPSRTTTTVIGTLATAAAPRVWPGANHHETMVIADNTIQA